MILVEKKKHTNQYVSYSFSVFFLKMRILTLLKWRRFRIICYFVMYGIIVVVILELVYSFFFSSLFLKGILSFVILAFSQK